jgi:hypothetical protein
MSVTALVAGRELDRLVAEKVMGFTDVHTTCGFLFGWPPGDDKTHPRGAPSVPPFSRDAGACTDVIKRLGVLGWTNITLTYRTMMRGTANLFDCYNERTIERWADTTEHALCLAALAAVEGSCTTDVPSSTSLKTP